MKVFSVSALQQWVLVATAAATMGATSHVMAAENALGIVGHSYGLGVSYSHFGDQEFLGLGHVQIRGLAAGMRIDDEEFDNIDGVDYDADLDSSTVQLGLDWYPFDMTRFQSVFLSGGVNYSNFEFEGYSQPKAMVVGRTGVSRSDNVTLYTTIEREMTAPYVSLGWGNRLRQSRNIYFQAEVGLLLSDDDADISVTAEDPNNRLSDADLQEEHDELQDIYGGVQGFASMGINFRF